MSAALELIELKAADAERLERFYRDVYEREFPDPDERESLENIARYLALKESGWYGENDYHVVLACRGGTVVGGCILDYLAAPNAGVIEFLFVVAAARGSGVGRALLAQAEQLAARDAARSGRLLAWMAAEMNDPFIAPEVPDNMDPFSRARIWNGWGFGVLDCPYVQPALSDGQQPAAGLLLIAKPIAGGRPGGVPAAWVRTLVAAYLRWAMRIEAPEANAQFRSLAGWLDGRAQVEYTPLVRYIGEYAPAETAPPAFDALELRDAREPAFAAAIEVYRRAFDSPSTAVQPDSFIRGLRRYAEAGYRYHLWALRSRADARIAGMASFFGFARMGFGGYVVLEGALRGAGCLSTVLARMEQQLVADALDIRGWLIECETEATAAIFRRCGFFALDVDYRQPDLPGSAIGGSPPLILMYRPLGRAYGPPRLAVGELLDGLRQVLRHVYRVADPSSHPTLRAVAANLAGADVPLRY